MENNHFLCDKYVRISKDGVADASGKYLLFGSYPRDLIKNKELISTLNSLAGELPTNGRDAAWISYKYYIFDDNDSDFMWYIDIAHEGQKYRGVYFTQYRPNDTINISEENCQEAHGYLTGAVYWFSYQPLTWKILEERNGKAWIITDRCIDAQAYRTVVWENSYVKSSIRKWLNNDFITTAFGKEEQATICAEIVTNNMEEEDVCDGDKKGSDTFDLIHLLSVEEADGLIAKGERQSTATDYAICQGINVNPENGNSPWWLRSPYYSIESWAQVVGVFDFFDFCTGEVGNTDTGVRPALWLKL